MIADLGDDEIPHIPSGVINQSRSPSSRMTDHEGARAEEGTKNSATYCISGDFFQKAHTVIYCPLDNAVAHCHIIILFAILSKWFYENAASVSVAYRNSPLFHKYF